MGGSQVSAGISPLDEAHGRRLAGDRDGALRLGIAILEAADQQLGAAALLASVLIDEGRTVVAGEVAGRLAEAWLRRGDLPAATAAAHLADRAGEDGAVLRRRIAEAFGEGSARLGDVSPAPPPLPSKGDIAPRVAQLEGLVLLDRAEDALQKFLTTDDPVDPGTRVPALPLFSALAPDALARLLEAFELREAPVHHEVISQGEEGREAFVVIRGLLEVLRRSEDGAAPVTLAALGPGALFGEMALVSESPRAASVVAAEPTQLLCVSRDSLEALAADVPAIGRELGRFCRGRMLSNLARHSAILRKAPPERRHALMALFESVSFEPGEPVVREGQDSEGLFLIASGGVEVTGTDAEGERLPLATLGPGDVVGEISLVLRRPATADVVARHPTVALRLSRARFQEAIEQYPGLLNELYDIATKREEETRSVVAQQALDVEDAVLV
ncbi:MAG: cyclic nucleotide-binding domain-containing protein [Myxococcota bacterium]